MNGSSRSSASWTRCPQRCWQKRNGPVSSVNLVLGIVRAVRGGRTRRRARAAGYLAAAHTSHLNSPTGIQVIGGIAQDMWSPLSHESQKSKLASSPFFEHRWHALQSAHCHLGASMIVCISAGVNFRHLRLTATTHSLHSTSGLHEAFLHALHTEEDIRRRFTGPLRDDMAGGTNQFRFLSRFRLERMEEKKTIGDNELTSGQLPSIFH